MKTLFVFLLLVGSTSFAACPNLSGTYCSAQRRVVVKQQACEIVEIDDSYLMKLFRDINVKDDVKIKETFKEGKLWVRLYYGAHFTKSTLELFEIAYWAANPQKTVTNTSYSLVNGNLQIVSELVGAPANVEQLSPCR